MQVEVDMLEQKMGYWTLVRDSPFRDAFVAVNFAFLRRATGVRLGEDPPDFHLSGVLRCDTFEVVETYHEGRRRSDEYRQLAEAHDKRETFGPDALTEEEKRLFKVSLDPDDEGQWEARAGTASSLLSVATAKKCSKNYPTEWGLVVLLDMGGFVHNERAIIAQMQEGTALARHRFVEVWVIWGRSAWCVWCGGELRMECLGTRF